MSSLIYTDAIPLQTITILGGTAIIDSISGTTPTTELTIVPPGRSASEKFTSSTTAASSLNVVTAATIIVGRLYFYLDALPTTDTLVLIQGTNASGNFLVQLTSAGIRARVGTTNGTSTTVTTGVWHRLDLKMDASGGTAAFSLTLDGVSIGGSSAAQTSANITAFRRGFTAVATADPNINLYTADIALSATGGDYPIGPGHTKMIFPTGKGTHVPASGAFQNAAAAAITDAGDSTTQSWTYLDEVPPNATDYVAQTVIDAAGYLEYTFADMDALDQSPDYVASMTGIAAASGASQNSTTQLVDGASVSTGVAMTQVSAGPAYWTERLTTPPSGGTWNTSKVNALKARWGKSGDVTPNPRLTFLCLLVNVPLQALTESATVTCTATATAIEVVEHLDSATVVPITTATAVDFQTHTETATIVCTATATGVDVYTPATAPPTLDAATTIHTLTATAAEGKQYSDTTAVVTTTTFVNYFGVILDDFYPGTSSAGVGANYGAYLGLNTAYTLDGLGGAVVNLAASGSRSYMYLPDTATTNVIVYTEINPAAVPGNVAHRLGPLLHSEGTNRSGYWCRANPQPDGSVQILIQAQNADGSSTNLTASNNTILPAGSYVAGRLIRIKGAWLNGTVYCKVWLDTQTEPLNWQVSVVDSTFPSGNTAVKLFNGDVITQNFRVKELRIEVPVPDQLSHVDTATPTSLFAVDLVNTVEIATSTPHTSLDNKIIPTTIVVNNPNTAEKLLTNDAATIKVTITPGGQEGRQFVDSISVGKTYLGTRMITQKDIPNVGDSKNATVWADYVEDTKLTPNTGRGLAFRNCYSNMNVADIAKIGLGTFAWPDSLSKGAAARNEIAYMQIHAARFDPSVAGSTPSNPVVVGDCFWDSSAPNLVGTEKCIYRGVGVTGDFDTCIVAIGNALKAWGHPFWLCFHHEFADDYAAQGYNSRQTAAVGWANAFNRWHQLWTPLAITNNLGWIVNMTDDCFDGSIASYPQVAYNALNFNPDFVGVDSYTKSNHGYNTFQTMLQPSHDYAVTRGVPLFIGELGYDPTVGDGTLAKGKGQWYRDMVNTIKGWNNVAAVCFQGNLPPTQVYLDYESHPTLQADATNSFYDVFRDPYFNPAGAYPPTVTALPSGVEVRFRLEVATVTVSLTATTSTEAYIQGDAAIVPLIVTASAPLNIAEQAAGPTHLFTASASEDPPDEFTGLFVEHDMTADALETVELTDLSAVVLTVTTGPGTIDIAAYVDGATVTQFTTTFAPIEEQVFVGFNDYLLDVVNHYTHWSVSEFKRFHPTPKPHIRTFTSKTRWQIQYKGRGLLTEVIDG